MMPIVAPSKGTKKKKSSRKYRKLQASQVAQQRVALIESIKSTQNLLKHAHSAFQEATDPDLVESYVYEINALKARHNYLSKQLRDWEDPS